MRRLLLVGAAVAAAVVALAVVAVVRSGGTGDETVQTVAGREITRDDLELAVEHFHEEADREGRPFPAKGTGEYYVRLFYGVAYPRMPSMSSS